MPFISPPKRCIYCDSLATSDEHIIPNALGGKLIYRKASCEGCRKITSEFERVVTREMYWPLRLSLGIKGSRKHKKERPTHWFGVIEEDEKIEKISIPIGKLPRIYSVIKFPPPGILRGEPPSELNPEMQLHIKGNDDDIASFLQEVGASRLELSHTLEWAPFARMIAKICHAAAVSVVGLEGVEFFLPPLIRGESNNLSQYVGCVENASDELRPPCDLQIGVKFIGSQAYL